MKATSSITKLIVSSSANSRFVLFAMVALFTSLLFSACSVTPQPDVTTDTASQPETVIVEENPVIVEESTSGTKTPEISEPKDSATAINPLDYQDCTYPPANIVQACDAQQGKIQQVGMRQCYQCVFSYADAGKACQDSSDCSGSCRQEGEFVNAGETNQVGQCASDSSPFGCYQEISDGVAQSAICVD